MSLDRASPAGTGPRTVGNATLRRAIAAGLLLSSGCAATDGKRADGRRTAGDRAVAPAAGVTSVHTRLDAAACREEPDPHDPNETPYLLCPGVGGYALIVRRVDAGRRSIDLVDATRRAFPLDYHVFVTRHMATLSDSAEWRVATRDGRQVPIALIVRVRAREDAAEPERVTRTYVAVAKVTPTEVCVTDRIPDDARSAAEVRGLADAAPARPCAPAQPPMTAGGAVVR